MSFSLSAVWQRRSVTLSREKGKRRGERRASFALSRLVSLSRARSLLPPAAAASFHLALFLGLSLSFPEQPTAREAPPVPNLGVGRGAEATRKGRASERLSLFQRKGLAGLFFLFFFGRSLAPLSWIFFSHSEKKEKRAFSLLSLSLLLLLFDSFCFGALSRTPRRTARKGVFASTTGGGENFRLKIHSPSSANLAPPRKQRKGKKKRTNHVAGGSHNVG